MNHPDPKDIVRRGYDELSLRYRGDAETPPHYASWIGELSGRLGPNADVLDLGCGCGVPVARDLSAAGHRVTGIDISDVQIERAQRLVPGATFVRGDATQAAFPPGSFDAVVCLYTIIHVPLDEQAPLLGRLATSLRHARHASCRARCASCRADSARRVASFASRLASFSAS